MTRDPRERTRTSVAAYRAKQAAAGMVEVNAYIPSELADAIDQIKTERGASSRAPIIIEAVKAYIETIRA